MNRFTPCLPAVANTEDASNSYTGQSVTEHPGHPGGFLWTSHFGTDMHPIALEFPLSFQISWIAII